MHINRHKHKVLPTLSTKLKRRGIPLEKKTQTKQYFKLSLKCLSQKLIVRNINFKFFTAVLIGGVLPLKKFLS